MVNGKQTTYNMYGLLTSSFIFPIGIIREHRRKFTFNLNGYLSIPSKNVRMTISVVFSPYRFKVINKYNKHHNS